MALASAKSSALEDNNKYLDSEIEKYQLMCEQDEAEMRRKKGELRDRAE